MANSENEDNSEDREDAVMDALCRHTNRTKIDSLNKENQETTHSKGEETPANTVIEN